MKISPLWDRLPSITLEGGWMRVISMEDWVVIKNLKKKNPGLGTRAIARLVGVSRSTVKKALVSEQYPRYSRVKKVNTALEPFEEYIKEYYLIKRQKVRVILENLRSKGFLGSGISLYRYIAEHLRPERGDGRVFMPYETLPGEQMLYDWSDDSVGLGSERVKVYVHLTGLGWSRYKVLSAHLSIKQSDVLGAMEEAFWSLGVWWVGFRWTMPRPLWMRHRLPIFVGTGGI